MDGVWHVTNKPILSEILLVRAIVKWSEIHFVMRPWFSSVPIIMPG